jgi:hypothetical protein
MRTRLPRPLPLGGASPRLPAPPSPRRLLAPLPPPPPLGPGAPAPGRASICALARRIASAYAADAARPLSSCAMTARQQEMQWCICHACTYAAWQLEMVRLTQRPARVQIAAAAQAAWLTCSHSQPAFSHGA